MRLVEAYLTHPPAVVYHGSKNPNISNFEYREGTRSVLWTQIKTKANGFFFALNPQDAAKYGRYVGCYKIVCNKPLISGTEGVDSVAPNKIADMNYIFAALLEEDDEGNLFHEGLMHITYVNKSDLEDPSSQWFMEFVGAGGLDWECLDNAEFVKRMRERGYDGTVVYEPESDTKKAWFVVSPQQIQYLGPYKEPSEDDYEEDE